MIALLSVFGKEVFRAGAYGNGLLFAARGLGALLGPFLLRALSRDDNSLLTMSVSSLAAGIVADRLGPVVATVGTASICIAWAIFWSAWTRKLWR